MTEKEEPKVENVENAGKPREKRDRNRKKSSGRAEPMFRVSFTLVSPLQHF